MRRTHFSEMNCSVAQCLEVVGERWTPLILRDALMGVTRFDTFQVRSGIARNILSQRLESLVEHGVMTKALYQEKPPRFEYLLTERGRDLWVVIAAMRQWGDKWAAPKGPPVVVEHVRCGHRAFVVPTCEHCREAIELEDLKARRGT